EEVDGVDDQHLLRELRVTLRRVLGYVVKEKKFACFITAKDESLMDLDKILNKINTQEYTNTDGFKRDLFLLRDHAIQVKNWGGRGGSGIGTPASAGAGAGVVEGSVRVNGMVAGVGRP
ncbi:unnamed protein product, partial [Discosporangium mesarthrocarpum]